MANIMGEKNFKIQIKDLCQFGVSAFSKISIQVIEKNITR